jgi:hypothetical protein
MDKKLARVQFAATPSQIERWERAAQKLERFRSSWIALACDYAATIPEGAIPVRKHGSMRAKRPEGAVRVDLRASDEQVVRWKVACAKARRTFADWAPRACDAFVGPGKVLYAPASRPKRKRRKRSPPRPPSTSWKLRAAPGRAHGAGMRALLPVLLTLLLTSSCIHPLPNPGQVVVSCTMDAVHDPALRDAVFKALASANFAAALANLISPAVGATAEVIACILHSYLGKLSADPNKTLQYQRARSYLREHGYEVEW